MQRRPGRIVALAATIASMACVQSASAQQPAAQAVSPQQPAAQAVPPQQSVTAQQPAVPQPPPAPQPTAPASPAAAQQSPAAQPSVLARQPAAPTAPPQRYEPEEGFFRPAEDAALTRLPDPVQVPPRASAESALTLAVDPQILEAERRAREAAERDLERAAREHREAQATVPAPRPIVISPLEGTANITSPLDGTANILSPIGR